MKGERFVGAISSIKARAPVTGGNFGVWGGMFSTFDCAVKGWRQKEDAWNAIISGFMTGGCLAARSKCLGRSGNVILFDTFHRWAQIRIRVSSRMRYTSWCVRGCWGSSFSGVQRRTATAATTL